MSSARSITWQAVPRSTRTAGRLRHVNGLDQGVVAGGVGTSCQGCMDVCCLTDFDELIKTNGLKGHGIFYYVPSLLKHFQTAQINELIVPRPHLSLNGAKIP